MSPLPSRLVGYGAYNLCFDKWLGRKQPVIYDNDFFKAIRYKGFNKINLVKVICFRHHLAEDLDPTRAVPLYSYQGGGAGGYPPAQIAINPDFLSNLSSLVQSAAQHGFWVQVCIFHQHAISNPLGFNLSDPKNMPKPERPDPCPPELKPADPPKPPNPDTEVCARLKKFFNPRPADPNQLVKQKELVRAIVNTVKGSDNVIYEIANEVRMEGQDCTAQDNCALAEWLNIMGNEIIQAVGYVHFPLIGTSTGTQNLPGVPAQSANEEEVFKTCMKHFSPGFFDFHFGQWFSTTDLLGSISAAINRIIAYKGQPTPLIINDDGAKKPKPNPSPTDRPLMRLPENVEAWARAAFSKHLHYASKETYPNGSGLDFNLDVLSRLNNAAATVP